MQATRGADVDRVMERFFVSSQVSIGSKHSPSNSPHRRLKFTHTHPLSLSSSSAQAARPTTRNTAAKDSFEPVIGRRHAQCAPPEVCSWRAPVRWRCADLPRKRRPDDGTHYSHAVTRFQADEIYGKRRCKVILKIPTTRAA